MAEKKYCPRSPKRQETCMGEQCAWWVEGQYRHDTGCAYFVIANALTTIADQGDTQGRKEGFKE